jgi:hypothetical protein
MAVENLTDEQLEARLDWLELLIVRTKDTKSLPALNDTMHKLLDEQVRRDLVKGKR